MSTEELPEDDTPRPLVSATLTHCAVIYASHQSNECINRQATPRGPNRQSVCPVNQSGGGKMRSWITHGWAAAESLEVTSEG
eukprot:scaffold366279_cov17-Prasinocladus_malaysianus.AAC.2